MQNRKKQLVSLEVTRATPKRLKDKGMIRYQVIWVLYKLETREFGLRLLACEESLEKQRRKRLLLCILTGDKKSF